MTKSTATSPSGLTYGFADATYRAAGSLDGITRIVDQFYANMENFDDAKFIRDMHPKDLTLSKQKLIYFLSGWMGGPKLFAETFGTINIPVAHSHLPIDEAGRDAWLNCMDKALVTLNYPEDFRQYLMSQLSVPAESIRLMCKHKPDTEG